MRLCEIGSQGFSGAWMLPQHIHGWRGHTRLPVLSYGLRCLQGGHKLAHSTECRACSHRPLRTNAWCFQTDLRFECRSGRIILASEAALPLPNDTIGIYARDNCEGP